LSTFRLVRALRAAAVRAADHDAAFASFDEATARIALEGGSDLRTLELC
jgi:hypothetical protein